MIKKSLILISAAMVLLITSRTSLRGQAVLGPEDRIAHSVIKPGKPLAPIRKVSSGRIIHRFHDTSPLSPSGKLMALFRVPFEDRYPEAGEAGEVILVNMKTGKESVVATSFGWEMQVGANVQWGGSDEELYYNDVDTTTWEAHAVKLNPLTGEKRKLQGTVFMSSLDGKKLVSYNLVNSVHAQSGYGVILPDSLTDYNVGPVATDGIYITDTKTGKSEQIVTIRDIYENTKPSIRIPNPEDFAYYCFKIMWNPQKTRIMTLVQWTALTGGKRKIAVITMNPDGSDMHQLSFTPIHDIVQFEIEDRFQNFDCLNHYTVKFASNQEQPKPKRKSKGSRQRGSETKAG